MVFSSHLFVFYFLPLALVLYYLMPRRGRQLGLTAVSYIFYGWWNPAFVLLMLFSTVVDYLAGLFIARHRPWQGGRAPSLPEDSPRSRGQRLALAVSVLTNLGLLGFFKYFNFAVESVESMARIMGVSGPELLPVISVTLPLGISFYTFQSMSYTIDVYRGRCRALSNPVDFACYVSLFPQLVAGPIIRFAEVEDQLRNRSHTLEKFSRGVAFFCLGMAKKILLANPCGQVADLTFGAAALDMGSAWYGLLAYSFQIYFDFSGYSDMAIGLGLMLGFVFPKNFDSPYLSGSITEFWRRWHVSLSTWLRDYLYLPLGGNRKGPSRTYVNLALVMLLGGLWHGAAWTFVLWGAFHGVLLALERSRPGRSLWPGVPKPVQVAATFLLVALGWVLFRAQGLEQAVTYFLALLGQGTGASAELVSGMLYRPWDLAIVVLSACTAFFCPQTWDWTRRLTPIKAVVALSLLALSLVAMETQGHNPFIYFIF